MLSDRKIEELKEYASHKCPQSFGDYTLEDLYSEMSDTVLDAHNEAMEYSEAGEGDYDEYFDIYIGGDIDRMCIYYSNCHHIVALVKQYDAYDVSHITGDRFKDVVEHAYTSLDYFVRETLL